MSSLEIRADIFGSEAAFLELVNTDLDIQKEPLSAQGPASFEVEPGSYMLRAHWSNGQLTQQVVDVGENDLTLDVSPPTTGKPDLVELGDPLGAAQVYLAPYESSTVALDPFGISHRSWTEMVLESFQSFAGTEFGDNFTLWQKLGDAWKNVELKAEPRPIKYGFEFSLDVDEGMHVLAMSGGGQTQFTSLPAERSIIAVRLHRRHGHLYLRVDARTADLSIEALRRYIVLGELDVARGLALNVTAERFLMAKMAAPRIAALGAYFLLRIGDLDRLHDWPDNLSNWKKWLPDGPVISAWQRLRSPDPDYEVAFSYLLEAERRGMPVYTEGVRLLKDGLDLFSSDTERRWQVEQARSRVERYAQAMLWDKSETTYVGSSPDEPQPYLTAEGIPWGDVDEQQMRG